MEPLIHIEGLSVDIRNIRGSVPVLRDVDMTIFAGRIHALVGPSGSGKTTLGALIAGTIARDQYILRSGHIWWFQNGRKTDLAGMAWEDRRQLLGGEIDVIFQEPATVFDPVLKVGDQLLESWNGGLREEVVKEQLSRLGLDPKRIWAHYPWQLSGGQQQRCLLARTMASNPALIIADEPTSALDKHRETEFLHDLVRLVQNEPEPGLLIISHNLESLAPLVDQMSVMKEGRIIEQGSAGDIMPKLQEWKSRPVRTPKATGLRIEKQLDEPEILLEVKNLTGGYKPGIPVVNQISASIGKGELLGVAGASGSGKSTLLRAILELLPWQEGEKLPATKWHTDRSRIQLVYQDPGRTMNPAMTIRQSMEEWGRPHQTGLEEVVRIMEEVGLTREMLDRKPHMFSGGQKQRLAIARALICRPDILLADEPFSSLDAHLQTQVLDLLRRLAQYRQIGIIVVAHDVRKLEQYCDRLVLLEGGRIFWEGQPDELAMNHDPRILKLRQGSSRQV